MNETLRDVMELAQAVRRLELAHAAKMVRGHARDPQVHERIDNALVDIALGTGRALDRAGMWALRRYDTCAARTTLVILGASNEVVTQYDNKLAARVRALTGNRNAS